MRVIEERFLDMLEAIQRIEKYAGRGRQAFVSDELIQTLNLRATNEKRLRVRIYQSLRRMRHFTHWVNAKFCRLPHRGSGKW